MKKLASHLPIKFVRKVFNDINLECEKRGESVVPFSDTDYYTNQILNIWKMSEKKANRIAKKLAGL